MPERKQLPHILLRDAAHAEEYSYPGGGGGDEEMPRRDRASHAARLGGQLEQARAEARERSAREAKAWEVPEKKGVHLEFESEPGFELALNSLEDARQGIELVSVRETSVVRDGEPKKLTLATVYVPAGKLKSLERKIHEYATANTKKNRPRHEKLLAAIADLRLASLRSFWTDDPSLLPLAGESIWWEIWLRSADEDIEERSRGAMKTIGLRLREESVEFPETRVLLAHGSLEQLSASVDVVDSIAELRRAKEVASFFMEMPRRDLGPWVDGLASRTEPPAESFPRLCVHDTGVNAGHPLLEAVLRQADCHAVDPEWRVHDHQGHGTGMAGLALYGDLTEALAGSLSYRHPARLESVKILPPPPGLNEPELYGRISEQAVYRVEVQAPSVPRTHVMAVTATDGRERGKPSSWSAAIDQLAFGKDDEPERLWVLAAGNSPEEAWGAHPEHLETEEIHDPGQAWNVLTVGACTRRWQIEEADFSGWVPLARPGGLGPSTSTSLTWNPKWPLKPDVVAEGGNAARSQIGQIDLPDSLRLLTTHYRPAERLLTTFGETSAASALVARIASTLWSRYPDFWPETVRALVVHSARWTQEMQERHGPLTSKGAYERLIRRCGFGVPSLEEALWSAENRLTLVTQEIIQPYIRKRNESGQSSTSLKELHLYALPWPVEQLRDLGETEVELRVTLSYFIEPNPSERGYQDRHRYASHGLRFDVRGATESASEFRKRLNKAAREKGERSPGTGDPSGWLVGSDSRNKGSIHSDIWRGSAIDLANRQHLAVFPVSGWWKERHSLERWKRRARYSLIVSIHAPEIEVDLYTPVSNQVGIAIEV